jgi:hypothetical protein
MRDGDSGFVNRPGSQFVEQGYGICVLSLASLFALEVGCGPEDYQKPIQQFEDAATVVINTVRLFVNNMNVIEQNEVLDKVVLELKTARFAGTKQG